MELSAAVRLRAKIVRQSRVIGRHVAHDEAMIGVASVEPSFESSTAGLLVT